jgi:glutathione S-transferase
MRRRGSSLVSQSPESKLAPAHGSIGRYRLLEWLNFLSTEIHRGFIPLLYAVAAGKWVDTARPKLESRFGWIDRQLNGQRFLVDEIGVPREYRPRPYRQLQAWYQRIRDRPAVQRVLREDGLLAD